MLLTHQETLMLNTLIRPALLLSLAAPLHAAQPGDYQGALQEYQARTAAKPGFSADEQAVMALAKAALATPKPCPTPASRSENARPISPCPTHSASR